MDMLTELYEAQAERWDRIEGLREDIASTAADDDHPGLLIEALEREQEDYYNTEAEIEELIIERQTAALGVEDWEGIA